MQLGLPINLFKIILWHNRECPSELKEAVASIIYAAPRCSDLPDLLQIKNLFAAKYGKEFIMAASELRPDTSVNRSVSLFVFFCIVQDFSLLILILFSVGVFFTLFYNLFYNGYWCR